MKLSEEGRHQEEIRALERANLEALRRAAARSAQLEAQAAERRRCIARLRRLSWIAAGAVIAAGLVLYVLFRLLQSF